MSDRRQDALGLSQELLLSHVSLALTAENLLELLQLVDETVNFGDALLDSSINEVFSKCNSLLLRHISHLLGSFCRGPLVEILFAVVADVIHPVGDTGLCNVAEHSCAKLLCKNLLVGIANVRLFLAEILGRFLLLLNRRVNTLPGGLVNFGRSRNLISTLLISVRHSILVVLGHDITAFFLKRD